MQILVLPKESYPTNRPMLVELWGRQITRLGVKLIWVMQAHHPGSGFRIVRQPMNTCYILPRLKGKGLGSKILNRLINFMGKVCYTTVLSHRHNIKAIHIHCGPEEGLIGIMTAALFKYPITYAYTSHFLLATPREQADHKKSRALIEDVIHAIRKILYKIILRKSDLVFPISHLLEHQLSAELGLPSRKMLTVPECAGSTFLQHPGCTDYSEKEKIRLVYIGSLGKTRNIPFIIDAFNIVHKKMAHIELILIGWGHSPKDISLLKEYVIKNGLNSQVIFKDPIPYQEVPDLISQYDIGLSFIPPIKRYWYATPTKCVEYMSLKLPVVANREIPDQRDLVSHANAGFLTNYHPSDAAERIFELATDPTLRQQFGLNGYNWIKKHRTFEMIAPHIKDRIQRLPFPSTLKTTS